MPFSALIKKYIDQNGGKSQFALTAVTPGTPINPAFPLVKVSKQEFQLIPVQDPPESTSNEDVKDEAKHYDAAELTKEAVEDDVKTEQMSPDKKSSCAATDKAANRRSDDQPKKIALRNLSASSSPVKPVSSATATTPELAAASKQETDGINIAPADANRNPGSIANQVAIRKARQPVAKKKEKPAKIKKVRALSRFIVNIYTHACLDHLCR